MGYSIGFYIKIAQEENDLPPEILISFPNGRIESTSTYMGIKLDAEQHVPQKELLRGYSKKWLTDVIWLSFQSGVDAFEFHHWLRGELVRSLVYGCYSEERTWDDVEGNPEPWESEVLFASDTLATLTKDKSSGFAREALDAWRTHSIRPGGLIPPLDSSACAHKIAKWYNLPHYKLTAFASTKKIVASTGEAAWR